MRVRLTAKLAEVVNGVDLSASREGDVVELPRRQAEMLIAERWAERISDAHECRAASWPRGARAIAADRKRTR